ncbi:MAG: phosphatidate cytidylyltransferase [Methanobacteriota archaeon]|nr:MAG: phosphatidate cytidylyltransferase [Euryarchaeota archaeon]
MTAITEGDIAGLVGVYGYVFSVLGLTWILRHRLAQPRKLIHVLAGGIVFFWWTFDSREVMAGLAAFPFVIILLLATPRSPVRLLRDGPLGLTSEKGHRYGLVMYAVSWTVIAYFMFDNILAASIAVAAMSFGDGMAEAVGHRYGRIVYLRGRTVEGTLAAFACATASVAVLVWFYSEAIGRAEFAPEQPLLFAAAIGAFISVVEAVTPGSIDNLAVPLVTGGYLTTLGV